MRADRASSRLPYAHDAAVEMAPESDPRAVGAAITVALCGHWQHDPPCPLAPHHTDAVRAGDRVRLRVLFATEPEAEPEVRARIDAALASGRLRGPDAVTTRWELRYSMPSSVRPAETAHAARL